MSFSFRADLALLRRSFDGFHSWYSVFLNTLILVVRRPQRVFLIPCTQSLLELISALPEQIIQPESREALCAEFCEYQSMESTLIPSYEIGDRIDLFMDSIRGILSF
jgi:hypothetical protein